MRIVPFIPVAVLLAAGVVRGQGLDRGTGPADAPVPASEVISRPGGQFRYFPPDTRAGVAAPGGRPPGRWFGTGPGPGGDPPGPPTNSTSTSAGGTTGDSGTAGPGSGDPRSPSEGTGNQPPGSEPISSNPA